MRNFFIIYTLLLLFSNLNAKDITASEKKSHTCYLKFTNNLLVDKTFYIYRR